MAVAAKPQCIESNHPRQPIHEPLQGFVLRCTAAGLRSGSDNYPMGLRPRRVIFQLGPPNAPKLTLDEWEALAKAVEAWFAGAKLESEVSGDPTNYGATFSRRETLYVDVPANINNGGA